MHADKATLAVLSVMALSSGQLMHVLEEYPSLKRPLEHGEQLNCVPLLNQPGSHGTHDPPRCEYPSGQRLIVATFGVPICAVISLDSIIEKVTV